MSRWFRWYDGTSEDGKFRVVARLSRVTVRDVLALWAFILEDASNLEHRGVCKRNEDFMSAILDFEDGVVESILSAMEDAGMISVGHGAITICNWGKRQFEGDSDPTATERQRRKRERDKQIGNAHVTRDSRPPDTDTEAEKIRDLPSEGPLANEIDEAKTVVEIYNAAAAECQWPACQRLTSQRRAAVNSRLREAGGIPGWQAAIDKAKASTFLRGGNDKGWRPDFDFFCQSKSFTKLMEGSYDDRTPGENRNGNGKQHASETVLRSIARVVEKRAGLGSGEARADDGSEPHGNDPPPLASLADDLEIPALLRRN